MDLRLIVEPMYPGVNVSPDFSSYDAMVAKWRAPTPPPLLTTVEIRHVEIINEQIAKDYLKKQEAQIKEEGVTTEVMVKALFDKAQGDETEFLRVNAIVEKAETDFPKP